ncbi:DUF1116 domain-containing protein [Hyphococcus sp.]|uniref:DUF1116 domain-containing protein n=1 Tax=Hyphococcus sp. TaxID=2038636 RepID=UPI003CCBA703
MTEKSQALRDRIDQANKIVLNKLNESRPVWFDVQPAIEALPNMTRDTILHAGPPIEWERMCEPQRNGVAHAAVFEGLAKDTAEAGRAIQAGAIRLAPCHEFGAVGGMAGITSASTPLAMVRCEKTGAVGCSQLFQGPRGQLPSRDAYDREAAKQWRWLSEVLGPVLQDAIRAKGGLDVRAVTAKALQMGDECHNRNSASSLLLLTGLAPWLMQSKFDASMVRDSLSYLVAAEQFSLCISMAAGKSAAEAMKNVSHSTVVTTFCRNGVDFGIRVSGLGDQWFVAPANKVNGLLFSSEWNDDDVVPDMGDSAIMETVGLGGYVQAAAPALQQFVSGSFVRAKRITEEMREITTGPIDDYRIPNLDFAPAPAATDIRKVIRTGITPVIDTAIAHKKGGVVGAGQTQAPIDCFKKALRAFSERYA